MKRTIYWFMMAVLACMVVPACSDDEAHSPENPPTQKEEPSEPPTVDVVRTMKDAFVEGTVSDILGKPIAGVTVNSGDASTLTDEYGNFFLQEVADASGRFVMTFEKDGFFTLTRAGVFEESLSMQVVMQPKGGENSVSESFSSKTAKTIGTAGMQVTVPPSSLVTLDGKVYEGTVRAEMFYLSPDNDDFAAMMPGGDLAAVRSDESGATLISYGMVEVSLSDTQGNKLQLKKGEQSQMSFPIPESMKDNPPSSIPLWYFDENAGLWVEEGEAVLQGGVYVGSVSHFSWHNLDVPSERVTITGKVVDCQGRPVPRVQVTVEQTSAMTRSDGTYTVYVPENVPVTVMVMSEDYYQYAPQVSVDVPGYSGGTVVRDVDMELPCLPVISGRVINTAGAFVMARLYCRYTLDGILCTTDAAYTDAVSGRYMLRIPSAATGPATLYVDLMNGEQSSYEIELSGEDLVKDIYVAQETGTEDVVTISTATGEVITRVGTDAGQAITVMADGTFGYMAPLLMCDEGSLTIAYEGYDGTSTSMDGATVAFYALSQQDGTKLFSSETAHIDIIEKTDKEITFTLQAEGAYLDAEGNERNAVMTATLNGRIGYEMEGMRTNVTDWSSLACAASVPVLKLPVDLVAVVSMYGMDIETLFYKGTMSDVESMGRILEDNGWAIVSEEKDGTSATVVYMNSSFAMLSISYDASGVDAPDGKKYQICVVPMV